MSWLQFFESYSKDITDSYNTFIKELYDGERKMLSNQFRYDFMEYESQYVLYCDLPNLNREKLNVEYVDDKLIISGERCKVDEKNIIKYHVQNRIYGSFEQSFTISKDINYEEISANYTNGVLIVVIPRIQPEKPKSKKIDIN